MSVATITDLDALPAVLTMRHVQQILGVSRVTAYELTHRHGFPVIRLGRSIRVPRAALIRWMDQQAGAQEGL
jgi:excisionase family DNA binding protein